MVSGIIDVPTFSVALTVLIAVVTVTYGALYLAGLRYRSSQTFFAAYAACTVGVAAAFTRDQIGVPLSVGLCNAGVGCFLVLLHRGLAHLTDQPRRGPAIDIALVGTLVAVQEALTLIYPSLEWRIALFSAFGTVIPLLTVRMLLKVTEPALRPVIRFQVIGISFFILTSAARIPMALDDELTSLVLPSLSTLFAFTGFFIFLTANTVSNFAFMAVRNQLALQRAAAEDPLTSTLNRRALDYIVARELTRHQRSRADLSVLVLDLDDFKGFNDRHGHQMGDQALRAVADRVRGCIRGFDTLARIGGEEFVVLLPECGPQGVVDTANRILRAIRQIPVAHREEQAIWITVSIGGATLAHDQPEDWRSLFDRADRALYQAKLTGRDRAVFADTPAKAQTLAV